jgi:hypothetical protein
MQPGGGGAVALTLPLYLRQELDGSDRDRAEEGKTRPEPSRVSRVRSASVTIRVSEQRARRAETPRVTRTLLTAERNDCRPAGRKQGPVSAWIWTRWKGVARHNPSLGATGMQGAPDPSSRKGDR